MNAEEGGALDFPSAQCLPLAKVILVVIVAVIVGRLALNSRL
jgi:hypothetical protein